MSENFNPTNDAILDTIISTYNVKNLDDFKRIFLNSIQLTSNDHFMIGNKVIPCNNLVDFLKVLLLNQSSNSPETAYNSDTESKNSQYSEVPNRNNVVENLPHISKLKMLLNKKLNNLNQSISGTTTSEEHYFKGKNILWDIFGLNSIKELTKTVDGAEVDLTTVPNEKFTKNSTKSSKTQKDENKSSNLDLESNKEFITTAKYADSKSVDLSKTTILNDFNTIGIGAIDAVYDETPFTKFTEKNRLNMKNLIMLHRNLWAKLKHSLIEYIISAFEINDQDSFYEKYSDTQVENIIMYLKTFLEPVIQLQKTTTLNYPIKKIYKFHSQIKDISKNNKNQKKSENRNASKEGNAINVLDKYINRLENTSDENKKESFIGNESETNTESKSPNFDELDKDTSQQNFRKSLLLSLFEQMFPSIFKSGNVINLTKEMSVNSDKF